jgi:epoxyqueuosine reductase
LDSDISHKPRGLADEVQRMTEPTNSEIQPAIDMTALAGRIKQWGRALGFQAVGIADIRLDEHERYLQRWLDAGYHGDMSYMTEHGLRRSRPQTLLPGTLRVISARMDYLPPNTADIRSVLRDSRSAYISRYALGRDYHKMIRKRLQRLAGHIEQAVGHFQYRAFVDSAPVLEKALAEKAGLGWIGKHTNLINRRAGSWFFLGELYTDLPLPVDTKASSHCGSCRACIDICPTQAIKGPYRLDARRCISYLTIELRGSIPIDLRPGIGNRIFGCDDCQLVCPWNRFARYSEESDFLPRHDLDRQRLVALFAWSEQDFLAMTEGSAIRRIGYHCWLRNIAVALGNALRHCNDDRHRATLIEALKARNEHPSTMVREHVQWALLQQKGNSSS